MKLNNKLMTCTSVPVRENVMTEDSLLQNSIDKTYIDRSNMVKKSNKDRFMIT